MTLERISANDEGKREQDFGSSRDCRHPSTAQLFGASGGRCASTGPIGRGSRIHNASSRSASVPRPSRSSLEGRLTKRRWVAEVTTGSSVRFRSGTMTEEGIAKIDNSAETCRALPPSKADTNGGATIEGSLQSVPRRQPPNDTFKVVGARSVAIAEVR